MYLSDNNNNNNTNIIWKLVTKLNTINLDFITAVLNKLKKNLKTFKESD